MTSEPNDRPRGPARRLAAAVSLVALVITACRTAQGVEQIDVGPIEAGTTASGTVDGGIAVASPTSPSSPSTAPPTTPPTTVIETTTTLPPLPVVRLDLTGELAGAVGPGGFAGEQGLTGGAGHHEHVVTTTVDRGPGSYREALSGGQRIVRFDPALDGATIVLDEPVIAPGSDITLDGSGVDVVISGRATRFTGTNVIVAGMQFRDLDGSDEEDALTFLDASETQVLGLFGNVFATATDGLVDLIWNRGNDVYATACGNRFEHHDKAMLIHSGRSGREKGTYHVTLCRNHWLDTYQRTPLSRAAFVHQYNSVFERYGKPNGDGGGSKSGSDDGTDSQHLLESNVAIPRAVGETTFDGSVVTTPRTEWAGPQLGGEGDVRVSGTLLVSSGDVLATEAERGPDRVFSPPYRYDVRSATPALRSAITATAGRCVPSGVDRVVPCAPTLLLARGDRIAVDVDGEAASVDVVVDGVVTGPASRDGDGRWTLEVTGDAGTAATVAAVARTSDGRTVTSDVVVVGVVG